MILLYVFSMEGPKSFKVPEYQAKTSGVIMMWKFLALPIYVIDDRNDRSND